ncbi:MAG TPA: fibronectin type III domain-containing protein [Candidatus Limnocylindrales bacterium]|nr:fibronectin type III domain-containing protein [Candidatus Limnocylindrales bacterium]
MTAAVVVGLLGSLVAVPSVAAVTTQTIDFLLPTTGPTGATLELSATATSGLPVQLAVDTPDTCSLAANALALTNVGSCTVTATQDGDATFASAPPVTRTIEIADTPPDPQPQTLAFTLPAAGYVGATVELNGSLNSPLEVVYTVETPGVCASDGTTLALDAAGTCTVTASQPGNVDWLPAEAVTASMDVRLQPFVTDDGATLGRYALNSAITSMEIDPGTGITYLGGMFTQIGVRTGSVAVVNGPGSGSDALQAGSPDVIASQVLVLPDDAGHYFISGQVGSINGDGIRRDRWLTRMSADGAPDPAWKVTTTCGTSALPMWAQYQPRWAVGNWIAQEISLSATAAGNSTVGLVLIDRATGLARRTGAGDDDCGAGGRLWPSVPVFAPLVSCSTWQLCTGHVSNVAYDATTHTLLAATSVIRGVDYEHIEATQNWLVAYDTLAGTRRWAMRLESPTRPDGYPESAQWEGQISALTMLGGAALVSGSFPIEAVNTSLDTRTTTMLLDLGTGAVLQRWNRGGEQDLADPQGDPISPATPCTPLAASETTYDRFSFVATSPGHASGYGMPVSTPDGPAFTVCEYAVTGTGMDSRLTADARGMLTATAPVGLLNPLPSTLVAGRYLAGAYDAFDLETGQQVPGWHPTPSSSSVTVVALGTRIVLGGDFTFLHGMPAPYVTALDADLAPVAGFDAALGAASDGSVWLRAIARLDDHIIAIGRLEGAFGTSRVVALDARTGAVTWSAPDPVAYAIPLALAVDEENHRFYVSYEASASQVERYVPDGDGWVLDPTFQPSFTGIGDAPAYVMGLGLIGGRLYLGGNFVAVDGQPRQGLARLAADGTLDPWAPQLITEINPPADAIPEISPRSFLEIGDRVLVSGTFRYLYPQPGGGGYSQVGPPGVVIYDATSGARIRPAVGATSWYGNDADNGYGAVSIGSSVYVALGSSGIAAFDPITFDYQSYRSIRTWGGWGSTAIYALAVRTGATPLSASHVTVATPAASLVLGGELSRWANHTASNVVELGQGALNSDHAAPAVASVTASPRTGASLGATVPFTVTWTGKDTGGSGVSRYELAQSRNGGPWSMLSVSVSGQSRAVGLVAGSTYRFRVRAVDRVGNIGPWSYSTTARVHIVQGSAAAVTYRGSWRTGSSAVYSGGTTRYARSGGSTATHRFTGRAIALVSTVARSRGRARVYVDGALVQTIDLWAPATATRRVVWKRSWATSRTHTIRIVVLGTPGRPRVDLDAFVTWR